MRCAGTLSLYLKATKERTIAIPASEIEELQRELEIKMNPKMKNLILASQTEK